jgi:peptide/nickel transport system permease protein
MKDLKQVEKKEKTIHNFYTKIFVRFFKNKLGIVGLIILFLIVILGLFPQLFAPYNPTKIETSKILQEPSREHWFGTDELGRDILSRVIYGTRITLLVITISIVLALVIGIFLGLIAGYSGRILDTIIMRIMDALLAFPAIVLALTIIAILGTGIGKAMIAIAIINIPKITRIVRGQVLTIKESEYISSAKSIGCSKTYILLKEILPNCLDVVIIYGSLLSAEAIIVESSLSFLGLGVQPPTPSWGWMVSVAMGYWNSGWWMAFFPGVAIFLTVLSINFMGDAFRDAFDTRLRL